MEVVLGIIAGVIIAFTYIYFFGDDNTYINENKELKELRKQTESNNTKILNVNRKQEKLIKEISELTEINTYNNEKAILDRIKELVRDYQSKN